MKKLKKKIDIVVEKTATGYSAYAEDQGAFTTSKNIPSLYENLLEALNLHYEEHGYLVTADNLRLRMDLQQFFQYYKVLNANFLAKRIGMNPSLLSQYVRGKKQPSNKQTEKIMHGIQNIGMELSSINFV
ncbi:MAG: helix-turn-helix transcriptional regulator [Flavobacteriales bacterium]|mgnify:FL=1|nr:helix-turn-helix transcriptional regulator [Flavobacteriales bacterium]MBK6945355.1 helix-turn-helix transcriptional regulator [Flavobacteriales bacterium]MBK7241468.1 helix-turn-helix transcriptional regulator [Flavobacteriales bacterium]MBK7298491.1 helix-turn-helix transcriptional regulator [Flavobacteriales bacterium]MBK9535087.1 helix-turn-helix transcriptional regulator [Flavobacteriales bacterium]